MKRVVAGSLTLLMVGLAPPRALAEPVCILPLGDSITAGVEGGYRKQMLARLAEKYHLAATTVGSQIDVTLPAGQQAHEGHPGWRIDQLTENLIGHTAVDAGAKGGHWLDGGHDTGRGEIHPTVITVMAGINDLNQMLSHRPTSGDAAAATTQALPPPMAERSDEVLATLESRLKALVDTLSAQRPDATILLGGCIPYANGLIKETLTGATEANRQRWAEADGVSAAQELGVNHWVIGFDRWIREAYVPELRKAGRKVAYVDVYAKFILPDGSVRGWSNDEPQKTQGPAAYADYGLHPNTFGYGLMGEAWADTIAANAGQ